MNLFIEDIVATTGGATDAGGQQGATLELAQTFMRNIQDYKAWFDELAAYADTFPLVSGTDTAFQIFQSVRPKIDDYFTRCQLVAFDVRASDALNAPERFLPSLSITTSTRMTRPCANCPSRISRRISRFLLKKASTPHGAIRSSL